MYKKSIQIFCLLKRLGFHGKILMKINVLMKILKLGVDMVNGKCDNLERYINRWDYIDLIEFIGMFFVLIYHSTTYQFSWLDDNNTIYFIRYYLRTILSVCVPLFFFANGYLLLNRSFNLKKHIFKIVNIVVLTVVWGIIVVLILMPIEHEFLSIREILSYVWTWHQGWINYLWYMGALVCIYIFLPILKAVFDTKRNIFIYFTIICALLTFGNRALSICGTILASGHEVSFLDVNLFNIFNPFRGIYGYSFVYFCVGGLAHSFKEKIDLINVKKRNIYAAFTLVLSCAGLFTTGIVLSKISGKMWDVVWEGYDTFFTFVNVCAIFMIAISYIPKKNSILSSYILNVSQNTLGIYFIHEVLIHLTRPVVKEWLIAQNFIGCIIYSLIILSISLSFSLVLRNIPFFKNLVALKSVKRLG